MASEASTDGERLRALVGRARRGPAAVPGAGDLARALGVSRDRLDALCRLGYHRTPSDLVARLRVDRASRLLVAGNEPVSAIAAAVGFATRTGLEREVRRRTGLGLPAIRALAGARAFELRLPAWLALAPLLRYWGRDPSSLTEQVDGDRARFALTVGPRHVPVMVSVRFAGRRARVALDGPRRLPRGAAVAAHRMLVRVLGLDRDPRPFERRAAIEPRMAALVARRRGLVVPGTRDIFEGLLWVIAGQQVSLAAAFALRRRLAARAGAPVADGLVAPPAPRAVAALEPDEVRACGFSARKAETVLAVARDAAGRRLDIDPDLAFAPAVEEALLARKGFGPWSVGYLMMRAWGFADCVPIGDVALLRRLAEVYGLPARPDAGHTQRLMAPFAPYRSLATFHLWNSPPAAFVQGELKGRADAGVSSPELTKPGG